MSTDERFIHLFVTEKKVGFGEDAEPLARHILRVGDVIGVFDGLGGAGATQVPDENEIDVCSMARLASRHTATTVGQVLNQWGKDDLTGLKSQLDVAVVQNLHRLAERKGGRGSEPRLRGTILHPYPTTVALAVVRPSKDEFNNRRVTVFWAGDSRVYAFDPSRLIPLQALTRDHSESGGDAALSRYASANTLDLEERDFLLPPATSVIAMTDGCYGYMSHFRLMYLMMSLIVRSRAVEEWIERVRAAISARAGDDSSFAITLGEGGFRSLQQQCEARLDQLEVIAHLVETSPPNPYVLPHDDSRFYEFLDADDQRRAARSLESQVGTPAEEGSFGFIAPKSIGASDEVATGDMLSDSTGAPRASGATGMSASIVPSSTGH